MKKKDRFTALGNSKSVTLIYCKRLPIWRFPNKNSNNANSSMGNRRNLAF
jgi:hypothetical protein